MNFFIRTDIDFCGTTLFGSSFEPTLTKMPTHFLLVTPARVLATRILSPCPQRSIYQVAYHRILIIAGSLWVLTLT